MQAIRHQEICGKVDIGLDLITACKAVLSVISKGSSRSYGTVAAVRRIKGQDYLVGTDGFMLVLHKLEPIYDEQCLGEESVLPFSLVQAISKLKGLGNKLGRDTDGILTLSSNSSSMSFNPTAVRFPTIEGVLPENQNLISQPQVQTVSLNPHFVMKASKAFGKANSFDLIIHSKELVEFRNDYTRAILLTIKKEI